MSVLLAASTVTVVDGAAAAAPPSGHLTAQTTPLDKDGHEVRGVARPVPAVVDQTPPAPVWPTADTVTVSSRAGGSARAATGVGVQVLTGAALPREWRDNVVLRLQSAAGAAAGDVRMSVDYAGFRQAAGAGWAQRLRVWQLPACALTAAPSPGCAATPVPSVNDPASQRITADVRLTAAGDGRSAADSAGTLFMLAAEAAGPGGDFSATSLAASSTWSAGRSSGEFTWSYPMRVPPAPGGPTPALALNYASSAVDGRSDATNNQPSWIGEGFEYWPGYIERRYVVCSEDMGGTDHNNTVKTGDLCWRSDNATMNLNGRSTELVFQTGKGWHGRAEDGSRIEKLTGAANGDDDGEHWKVTTPDGTRYFFGLNRPAGQGSDTASAWTVPVFGNHTDEPCHDSTFLGSDCQQAWRWNLDYVIDPRGNTMSYWYAKETNRYGQNRTGTSMASYVRGGTLRRIDYGTWDRGSADRSVNPSAQVLFTVADRCLSSCYTDGAPNRSKWYDTPWDQECKDDATSCGTKYSPTFWSTNRLTKITTRVWDTTTDGPAHWQDVDSWTLTHSFPPTGDGSVHAGLWLASVTNTGLVGTAKALPAVTFTPISLANRVLSPTNTTNNWQRIDTITTETGALINVDYTLPECSSDNLPSAPHTNTKRCYPVVGIDPADPYAQRLITEWWHKYLVTTVSESDLELVGGHQAPPKYTYYSYGGSPAWHYADDDGLVKPDRKTWSQFRGYATVTSRTGDAPGAQTLTVATYLRGMHGDRSGPSGGTRTVTVGASLGSETVYDEDQFAGQLREQVVYNGTTAKPVSKTVQVPWTSPPTATRTINGDQVTARYVGSRVNYAATALGVDGAAGWRVTRTEKKFDDTYGTVDWEQDDGLIDDPAAAGDETCVRHTYNRNLGLNILNTVKTTRTTALACATAPTSAADVISEIRNSYDGAASADTPPSTGLVTRIERLQDWSAAAGTTFQVTSESTFDRHGRTLTAKDVRGNVTTTSYTPAVGGPLTLVTTTSPSPYNWVSTESLAPYWGQTIRTVDPNGRTADVEHDALGRVAKVWQVGWSRTDHPDTPSMEYSYEYSPTRSAYVYTRSRALNAAGTYNESYHIFDAFLRPRQAQRPGVGGGRVVVDTLYDKLGRAAVSYTEHVEPGAAAGQLWWEPEWSVPAVTKSLFDNAGRVTASVFYAGEDGTNLVEKWRTTTSYEGDRVKVSPPAGAVATTTLTDVRGRTVQLRQHTTTAGVDGPYDTIGYAFNRKAQLEQVTDPEGNVWSYRYDMRGRQYEVNDPDKGRLTSEFGEADEVVKTTDARGEVLVNVYDQLGRKVELRDDSATGPLRAKWTYDRLYTGQTVRGQLTETVRYEPAGGANAYAWQVRNFTARYQPGGVNIIVPEAEGAGLAGTWVYGYGYSAYDGTATQLNIPAAGGLAGETVTTRFDQTHAMPTGLDTNLPGVSHYVTAQTYTSYGQPTVTTRKIAGGVYVENALSYDEATRRITASAVKPETATGRVADRRYAYDPSGNITAIDDVPQVGAADRQCFRYDALARLDRAWTPNPATPCTSAAAAGQLGGPAPYWLDWQFSKTGNRQSETSYTATGQTTRNFAVPTGGAGVARPHAVTGVTSTATGQTPVVSQYGYDNTGNTTCRPSGTGANNCAAGSASQELRWDAEGRLVQVRVANTPVETNIFDAAGIRLVRRDATGTTLYLPGQEIRRQGSTTTATRYYTFAGQVIGSRGTTSGLTWLFHDHQGTQQVVVSAAGQQVSTRRQLPFGGPRGAQPAWPTGKGFVGGDDDPVGLTYIGARAYDPALGRFLSVDPVINLSNAQQMHGYAYASNSPVTKSDPTGMVECIDLDCRKTYNPPLNPPNQSGGGGATPPNSCNTAFPRPPCVAPKISVMPVIPGLGGDNRMPRTPKQPPWHPKLGDRAHYDNAWMEYMSRWNRARVAWAQNYTANGCTLVFSRDDLCAFRGPEFAYKPPPPPKKPEYWSLNFDACFGACITIGLAEEVDGRTTVQGAFGQMGLGLGGSYNSADAAPSQQDGTTWGGCMTVVVGPCGASGKRKDGGTWSSAGIGFGGKAEASAGPSWSKCLMFCEPEPVLPLAPCSDFTCQNVPRSPTGSA